MNNLHDLIFAKITRWFNYTATIFGHIMKKYHLLDFAKYNR